MPIDDRLLEEVTESHAQGIDTDVRTNLRAARKHNPDQAAEALPLAEKYNVPLDTAQRSLETFKQKENWSEMNLGELRENHPALQRFLGNARNARLAHDDIPFLKRVNMTVSDIPKAFERGANTSYLGILRDKQMRGMATPEEIEMANNLSQNMKHEELGSGGWFSDVVLTTTEQIPIMGNIAVESFKYGLGGALTTGIAGQLGPQAALPEEILTVPAGFTAGSIVGAFEGSRKIEAGLAYDEYLQIQDEQGNHLDPQTARGAAMMSGMLNGALELVPLQRLSRLVPVDKVGEYLGVNGIKKAVKYPNVRTALKKIARDYGELVATETTTEVMQEAVTMYIGEVLKATGQGDFEMLTSDQQMSRLYEAGEGGFKASIGLGGLGSTVSVSRVLAEQNKQPDPQQVQAYLENARQTIQDENGKLLKRSPKAMREFLNNALDGETFFIDGQAVQTFYQSMSDDQKTALETNMPQFADRIEQAADTMDDIQIDRADYFAYIQPMDQQKMLDEYVRLVPEHYSAADVRGYEEMIDYLYEAATDEGGLTDADLTEKNFYDQLIQRLGSRPAPSGRVDVAQMLAQNPRAFYETILERSGGNEQVKAILDRLVRDIEAQRVSSKLPDLTKVDELDLMIDRLRNQDRETVRKMERQSEEGTRVRGPAKQRPLIQWLSKNRKIRPSGPLGTELRNIDITPKKYPSLFNSKGAGSLDNIPVTDMGDLVEFLSDDGAGYVDQQSIIDRIRDEDSGMAEMLLDPDQAYLDDLQEAIDRAGVSLDMSNAEIRRELEKLQREYEMAMGGDTLYQGPLIAADELKIDTDIASLNPEGIEFDTAEKIAAWNTAVEIREILWDAGIIPYEVLDATDKPETLKDIDDYTVEQFLRQAGDNRYVEEIYNDKLELAEDGDTADEFTADDDVFEWAIRSKGTTSDMAEAGYILPEGKMLDFSGKRQGGPSGVRYEDHRQLDIPEAGDITGTDLMEAFISHGAIRTDGDKGVFTIGQRPTREQLDVLATIIDGAGEGIITMYDGSRETYITVMDGDTAINNIRKFYNGQDVKSERFFQAVRKAQKNDIGLFSKVEQEVMNMNLPQWKPNKKMRLTPEEQARLDDLIGGEAITSTDDPRYKEMQDLIQKARKAEGVAKGNAVWEKIKALPVKDEELKWLGLEDYLKAGRDFTRDEVVEFIRNNGVEIEEVVADKEQSESVLEFGQPKTWDDPAAWEYRVEDYLYDFDQSDYDQGMYDEALTITANENQFYIEQALGDVLDDPDNAESDFADIPEVRQYVQEEMQDALRNNYEELARERAENEYMDDPIEIWESQFESDDGERFYIFGNDSQGYDVRLGDWKSYENVVASDIWSYSEAEIQAQDYAETAGIMVGEDDVTVAKWSEYVTEGPSRNYREIKLTLPQIEDDFYNETHFPDRNLVTFLRVTDRDVTSSTYVQSLAKKAEGQKVPDDFFGNASFTREKLYQRIDDYEAFIQDIEKTDRNDKESVIQNARQEIEKVISSLDAQDVYWKTKQGREIYFKSKAKTNAYFIDEFQSDWHQEGRQHGYKTGKVDAGELEAQAYKKIDGAFGVLYDAIKAGKAPAETVNLYAARYDTDPLPATMHINRIKENLGDDIDLTSDAFKAAIKIIQHYYVPDSRLTEVSRIDKDNALDAIESMGVRDQFFIFYDEYKSLTKQAGAERYGAPDAPFKGDNWIALGLKRALVQAAEEGAEVFAWADAEVLMDRWSSRYEDLYKTQYDTKMPSIVKKLTKQKPMHVTADNNPDGFGYWAIQLTPELRDQILGDGFSLFQKQEGDVRGSVRFMPDGKAIISLFEKEDLSTVLHELGHVYWRAMTEIAALDTATDQIKQDVKTIRDWVGAKDGETLTVEQEEMIADGFLDYIRKGEAPSVDLQNAFQRMKAWLVRLYRGFRDTLPKIAPEVKDVFDRMLATDEQIEQVRSDPVFNIDPMIKNFLTKAQAEQMQRNFDRSVEDSKKKLLKQALKQAERRGTKTYKDARASMRTRIEDEVKQERVYDAMAKVLENGGLNRKALIKRHGKEILPYLSNKGGLVKAKGVNPDFISDMTGYNNAYEMVMDMASAESLKERVDRLTDEALMDQYGDMLNDGTIEDEALRVYHNRLREKVLEMEAKAMAKMAGIPAPTKESIEALSIRILGDKTVREIIPYRFLRSENKAFFEYGKALGKKDFAGAAKAKAQQLLNHHLYRKSLEAKENVDKALKRWRRFGQPDKKLAKSKSMHIDYVYAIRAILSRHGIGKSNFAFDDWYRQLQAEEPDTAKALGELIDINTTEAQDYRDMSYSDFMGLSDAIEGLVEQSREMMHVIVEGKRRTAREAAELAADTIYDNNKERDRSKHYKSMGEQSKDFVSGFDKEVTRMEFLLKAMDGGEVNGPLTRMFINPVAEADNKQYAMNRDVAERFKDILDKNSGIRTRWREKVFDQRLGQGFTVRNIITIALNMGNEGNIEKLLDGYDWEYTDVKNLVERHLTKEDMDTVQEIWDLMEYLRPDLQRVHKQVTGFPMEIVKAKPLETKWGEYRGGYFPIVYDPSRSDIGARNQEDVSVFESNFTIPSVGKGMTKSRTSFSAPMLLDFDSIIAQHFGKTIHLITHGALVKDLNRIMMQGKFKKAVIDTAGVETYMQFKPWLQAIASNSVYDTPVSFSDKVLRHLRVATTNLFMGFGISTGIKQFLGYSTTLAAVTRGELSMNSFLSGMVKYWTDPANASSFVMRHSQEMPSRLSFLNADVANVIAETGRSKNIVSKVQYVGMSVIGYAQIYGVDMATWMAGFEEGMKRYDGNTAEASRYADAIVRQTQGSGNIKDLAKIQRESESKKTLAAMFGTYILGVLYPKMRELGIDTRDGKAARALVTMIPLIFLPALIEGLLADPPEDDEDFAQWLALKTMVYGASSVPLAGPVVQGGFSDFDYSLSPVESPINMFIGGIKSKDPDNWVKSAVVGIGLATRLPTYKPYKTIDELIDQMSGEEEFNIRELIQLTPDQDR